MTHQEQLIEMTQNHTVEDINKAYKDICASKDTTIKEELLKEYIRLYLSHNLMEHNENNKLKTNIILDIYEQRLCDLEKQWVVSIWQQEGEGIIWLDIYGEQEPTELDYIDLKQQVQIVNELSF